MRAVVFICAVAILEFGAKLTVGSGLDKSLVIRVTDPKDNRSTCTIHDAQMYSYDFHNCFIDKKYGDGGKDLDNIVDRILEHSRACIGNFTRECRPNYEGFMLIMDKVISQMKDYCFMYLEFITHGRNKIKDLQCVETSLSNATYQSCFREVFAQRTYSSEEKFKQKVENAISCTNKSHKMCSKAAKTSLNRMVRTILGVKQPKKEDLEDVKPKPPPMQWYDYIIQPIISFWKSMRSFFGF